MTADPTLLVERAERLAELHRSERPLVLLNAWDGGSARVFEDAGCPAIATTSGGIAFALGRADGERLTRAELMEATARIAGAVAIPVTADVEGGYGATPADVAETVELVLAAGAVGINLEDAAPGGAAALRDLGEQCERVRAARAAADVAGVPLFLNARTDACLIGVGDDPLGLALERIRAYADAGADGVFVPGLVDPDGIARAVAATDLPLNVLAAAGTPPVAELASLGVARLSVGSGPARAALGLARRIAHDLRDHGTYDLLTAGAIPYPEANALFG